jgi:DNA-binding response OmpR family regulator
VSTLPDVLLIEDDAQEAELIARALGRGLVVETLTDGAAAVDRLRVRRPRLVLLDLKMGGATGFDVLGAVRRAADLNTLPVVVLTSSSDPRDVERAYQLGAHGYVVKPIAHSRLAERLSAVTSFWLRTPAPAAGGST